MRQASHGYRTAEFCGVLAFQQAVGTIRAPSERNRTTLKMRFLLVPLSLVCVCTLTACPGTAVKSPTRSPKTSASFLRSLPNAEYPVEFTSTGKAQLEGGVFEEPVAPGSATMTRIRLGEEQAAGDVNGDGAEDAAVTLAVDPGGSGTFTFLALVINDKGTARPLAAVLLGDRITVKSLSIQYGSVVVTLLARKPDEPMSSEPEVEVTRTFKLQGDRLIDAD